MINNNNNNNNSNNNNNNIDNSIVFFKFYRNIYINKLLFSYINYYNKVYGFRAIFGNVVEYFNCKEREYLSNIVIGSFNSAEELLQFIKDIPECVSILKVKSQNFLNIDIDSLVIPSSLNQVVFSNGIQFIKKDSNFKSWFGSYGIGSYSGNNNNNINNNNNNNKNILYKSNIKSISIGKGCEVLLNSSILPSNLNQITLEGEVLDRPLKKTMLPDSLKSLSIIGYYKYSTIQFPQNLKSLSIKQNYFSLYKYGASMIESLPKSLTSLKLLCMLDTKACSFDKRITRSLVKLSTLYDNFNYTNNGSVLNSDDFSSLTSLNLSLSTIEAIIDIDSLPSTLVKLKLWSLAKCKSLERGYPASLTSLSGSLIHYSVRFQDPLNLKESLISFPPYYSDIERNKLQCTFDQFENLESLSYIGIHSVKDIFIINSISNKESKCSKLKCLEVVCHLKLFAYQEIEPNTQLLSILSNLSILKLDSFFTNHLFRSSILLPASLKVLDINVSSLFELPDQLYSMFPSFPLINSLVIRGVWTLPDVFLNILPIGSLQHIFILNIRARNEEFLMKRFPHLVRLYESNDYMNRSYSGSYLFKNFKSQLIKQ